MRVSELPGAEGKRQAQADLRGDLEVVRAYGAAHPGTWAGVRFQNDPAVKLVAAFRYPMPEGNVPPVRKSRYELVSMDGLELALRLDARTVEAGHRGHASVVIHNIGVERAGPLVSGQPLVGRLFDQQGREVGGLGGQAIAGTGRVIDLGPDETMQVPVLYGTASLRSDWGYLVPPGRYWLRVEVPFQRSLPGAPRHALAVPAEELTIVPRP